MLFRSGGRDEEREIERETWASEDARRKAGEKSTSRRMRRSSVADDRVCRRPTFRAASQADGHHYDLMLPLHNQLLPLHNQLLRVSSLSSYSMAQSIVIGLIAHVRHLSPELEGERRRWRK